MRGSEILLTTPPKGNMEDGIISDTSSPGMLVEMVPGTAFTSVQSVPATIFQGGRPKWRARSQTAGAYGPIAVLLNDSEQGFLYSTAYVANTRCKIYWPIPGDELNLRLADVVGTGDIVTQGDLFGVNNDGNIIRDSSYNSAPFQAMESLAAAAATEWVWVKFLLNRAG